MSESKARTILNQQHSEPFVRLNDTLTQFSTIFSSSEGYRILSVISSEECKLLRDIKKILEERTNLDKRYAQSLQELTAKADHIAWSTNGHPIISVG